MVVFVLRCANKHRVLHLGTYLDKVRYKRFIKIKELAILYVFNGVSHAARII
jgi:hypothetical protein